MTPLLNDHHASAAFFYYDRKLRKHVVQAGSRTKAQLEYLLENDRHLKKAMEKDSEESNRCTDEDFVEADINRVRGRAPIGKLPTKLEYMVLKKLGKYLRDEVYAEHVAVAAAKGQKPKSNLR